MTTTESHAKKRAPKQTAAQKKVALAEANRKARLQWYVIGIGFAVTVVVAVVLLTMFTEGELPYYIQGGGY